ncbi:NACHT domain-containing protein [Streptomyces sp. NPDC002156]
MDQARVVEVWVPGVKRFGSGYLLADCLVLTSYHLVRGLARGARVEVRPLEVPQRAGWLAATLSWPYETVDIEAFPERDAALLVIDDLPGGAGPFVGAVRFGQVTGMDRIPCEGLGFPDAEKRPDKQRDTMPVRGHVDTLQALKSGLLTVHVDKGIVARRLRSKDGKISSGWSGVSGAAMFCESLLVGVLATDRNIAEDASVLGAVPIATLADLPGFRDTLLDFGIDLQLEHASPAARHLSAYLAAAYRTAIQQPYAGVVPGTTPPLAAVYLRQQISRLDAYEARVTGAGPADSVLTDPPTCVILSGPGGGKSSLLRTRLANGVKRWQDGHSEDLLPVMVHAAALAQRTLTDALTVAASDLGLVEELPKAFFRSPPRPGARWLVLLDGLDEVADPAQRNKILHKIAVATTGEHAHLYQFVIATRPLPDGELDTLGTGVPRYDLQPFDHDDLETVVHGWFRVIPLPDPEGAARRFVQTLDSSRLADLARIPLMTAMLCQLHAAAPDQPLPASRGQIYRDFIILLGKRQNPSAAPNAQYPGLEGYASDAIAPARKVLEHLQDLIDCVAAERHAGNTLPALTIVQSRNVARCPKNVLVTDWRAFLDACLRRSGLLTPQGNDLVFLHHTLLEHLAARHLTDATHNLVDDPHTGTRAVRDVFHQPRRYWPRRQQWPRPPWPDGITWRVWGRRYWAPPDPDPSYVGFLLDAAHHRGRASGAKYLGRLTRGGLPGWEFIVTLNRLGTDLPDNVLHTTADGLYALAREFTQESHKRVRMADALAGLGDSRGADFLYALADGTALAAHERVRTYERVQAAEALANHGDPRAAELLYALAHDTTLTSGDRVRAAIALVDHRDPRAADLLYTLGHDTTEASYQRVATAVALAGLGDSRGADLLHVLAQAGLVRVRAAIALAGLGDSRGADLLHAVAEDTTEAGYDRMPAAMALAELGDPRAANLLDTLARDTRLGAGDRVRAAIALADRGDSRAADLLHALARNTTLANYDRVQAAEALAGLGAPAPLPSSPQGPNA